MNLRLATRCLLAKSQAISLVGNRCIGLQGRRRSSCRRPSRGGSADVALASLLSTILAGLTVLAGGACLASLASGGGWDLSLRVCLCRSCGRHLGVGASDVPDVQVCALGRNLGSRDRVQLAGRGSGIGREAKDERLARGVGLAGLLAELGSGDRRRAEGCLSASGGRGDVAAVAGHERAGKSRRGHGGEDDDVLDGRHFDCVLV